MHKSFKITIVVLCTVLLAGGWGMIVANPILAIIGGSVIGWCGAQVGLNWCD